VIDYSRDTSFHGWSPYVPYIWNTHHCNNISNISYILYEENQQRVHAIKSLMNKIKEIQDGENSSHILKSMFKKEDIISIIQQPRFSSLRKSMVDQVINQIVEGMNVEKVQSSCDDTGISRRGYETLFKCLQEGMVNAGIIKVVFPHPFHIANVHARSNVSTRSCS
jgi:hypothetical protein